MPKGHPKLDPHNRWRMPKAGPASGVSRRSGRRETMIALDSDQHEEIRALALTEQTSFAYQVRHLLDWGLDSLKERSKMKRPTQALATLEATRALYAKRAEEFTKARLEGEAERVDKDERTLRIILDYIKHLEMK